MIEYKSVNPATSKVINKFDMISDSQLLAKLEKGKSFSKKWIKSTFGERREKLVAVSEKLSEMKGLLASSMVKEMGKPLDQALAEVEKCISALEYYVDNGEVFLKNEDIVDPVSGEKLAYVTYEPVGVVLAIMPWNFPCWQLFRFLAPAVMAGNVIVMKHAENVPRTAQLLEKLFIDAGWDEGHFQNIYANHEQISSVIKDPRVSGVTFTGSTGAGKIIGQQAISSFKKVVLELGGSDPYIVLEDADVELAAEKILISRTINNGQSCIAAKRAVVCSEVYDRFCEAIKSKASQYLLGSPEKIETKIGPMARRDLKENLEMILDKSLSSGASVLFEGENNFNEGWYFPLTILKDVTSEMSCFREETFGPLLSVVKAENKEEAIKLASDTDFGLGAAVFTSDLNEAKRIAEKELTFGSVAINDFVKSNPLVPFGGLKESGIGKELGRDGIYEFVHKKSIIV